MKRKIKILEEKKIKNPVEEVTRRLPPNFLGGGGSVLYTIIPPV